jgi:hypothetical protein
MKTPRQKRRASSANSSSTGDKPKSLEAVAVSSEAVVEAPKPKLIQVKTGGWSIDAYIQECEDERLDEFAPDFNRLDYDPNVKVMRYSVTGDFYRLFAKPSFWRAALKKSQKEIDSEARKVVPAIPHWSNKTWRKVANLEPPKLFALADSIANGCSRVPKSDLHDRLDELSILITAWVEFDKKAKWFDPSLASSDALKKFLEAAKSYIDLDQQPNQFAHLTKKVKPTGRPTTLARMRQVIEGAHIWKMHGQPSIKDLKDILKKQFGWKRKASDGTLSNSLNRLTRDAIALGKSKV